MSYQQFTWSLEPLQSPEKRETTENLLKLYVSKVMPSKKKCSAAFEQCRVRSALASRTILMNIEWSWVKLQPRLFVIPFERAAISQKRLLRKTSRRE